MLLRGRGHRYTNYMVVITNWLTFWTYLFSNCNRSVILIYVSFSFLYHRQDLYQNLQWVTRRVSYKKQEIFSVEPDLKLGFLVGSVLLISVLWPISSACGLSIFYWLFGSITLRHVHIILAYHKIADQYNSRCQVWDYHVDGCCHKTEIPDVEP